MRTCCLSLLALMLVFSTVYAADEFPPGFKRAPSQYSEPGLTFGLCEELPMPKNILYCANPDAIIADAEAWQERGIDGFFMSGCVSGWESNVWATDGKPWTIGAADETLQKAKRATEFCAQRGMETFALMHFSKHFDWFDDIAWQHIEHNFRQFAIFAREAGCKGIVIDTEYVIDQYYFEWDGYDYNGYTQEDLVQAIRSRMTGVAGAMYDEFPGMVFVVMPELDFRLGTHIHVAWVEEAARRNAPGGIHYCMGYVYRNHNLRYILGRGWLDNALIQGLLSKRARRYWEKRCGLSPGVWPFGEPEYLGHGPELTPEELRHGLAGSLMVARQYSWVFGGAGCGAQLLERNMDTYTREEDIKDYIRVLAAREMVTNPKYVALAKEIRSMKLRDYSQDLGLTIETVILGPNDYGMLDLVPSASLTPHQQGEFWNLAIEQFHGRAGRLKDRFGTLTHWMLIGPFANEGIEFRGHHAMYPPEESLDLSGEYDGIGGKVRWLEHSQEDGFTSVDLTKVFTPTEHVCAFALCYVTVPEKTAAEIRVGTNDSGKVWLGGKLVFDYPKESGAILDKNVIPVTLPAGTTPVLLKVCNGEGRWGFVFRVTDLEGRPLSNLRYSLAPPE